MADLVVELYGTRVGSLVGSGRTFDFVPNARAVEVFGLDSPILSLAIPLTAVPVRTRKDRRQNFFRELLPEGRILERLARVARVAEQDVIGLLRRFGRDAAGALQIWDPSVDGEPREPTLQPLSNSAVAALLRDVNGQPLGNLPSGGKTSLAGVQDKIVLARTGTGWNQPLDGWPSTHIVKPEPIDRRTAIYDEEFGARLARAIGLAEYRVEINDFDGVPALVIERYDRSPTAPLGRIHQEDFNQILGASGEQKYQRYGGRVSLRRIAGVLSDAADATSRVQLFRLVVLSTAVGNLDLHAKNVSVLHPPDGSITLAPAYDVVPQAHQPNDGEMAMAIGDEYRHAALTLDHLAAEGTAWGLDDASDLARQTLSRIADVVATETPDPRAFPGLAGDIRRFTSNLLAGRPAGSSTGRAASPLSP